MKKILRKIKNLTELPTKALRASTATLGQTHHARWKKNAHEKPLWDERNVILAKHIPPGSYVLDLGAGAQTLRQHLSTCHYVPCDLVQSTPDCVLCDFNAGLYPSVDRSFGVVVCSGVIEYLREPLAFLKKIQAYGPVVLISYHPIRKADEKMARLGSGFLNHFRREEIERLFDAAGYRFEEVDVWAGQVIFRLTHGSR